MNKPTRTMQLDSIVQRSAFYLLSFILAQVALLSEVDAASVRGQVRAGGFSRKVDFKQPLQGEKANDENVISSQLRLDLLELNDDDDHILIDVRDKYDSYGKLERQNLRLSSYNRMQIRTLAYRRPWESNRLYFTLGRFGLAEANLLSHDGIDIGYRFSKNSRLGIFGGQGPKDILLPLYVNPNAQSVNNLQAGAYFTYEAKNGVEDSSYLTQAVGQAPTYDLTDKASHSYYFQQGMWTFTSAHRLSSTVLFDFKPASALRRAALSHIYTGDKVRTYTYIQQTKAEDYLIKQVIQDVLKPSSVQTVGFDLRHRLLKAMSVDYSLQYGKRTLDGLSQNELALGVLFPGLISDATSFRAQYGIRNNFASKDNFIRFGADYWGRLFGLGLSHVISDEDYKTGEKVKRQISMIDSSFFLSDDLRGTLGFQREQDDKVSASTLFVMLGYRFGQASVSPVRTKSPRFESM